MFVPLASSICFPFWHVTYASCIYAFVVLYNCFGFDFCYWVYLNVGSVMDASKRMMLAKAMKAARAAKAGASSAPATDPIPPSILPPPPPTTTEAPLG